MEIPCHPDSRPLALADKPLLDALFTELQPRVSELTFANLYLFRGIHDYRLTRLGDALVVLGRGYGGEAYALPPLSGDVTGALRTLLADGFTIYGADDTFLERHGADAAITVEEDRDGFDYLYLRSDLADLPGNRFHKKKNRINYFAARHPFEVRVFGPDHRQGCLALLDEWRRVRDAAGSTSLDPETAAAAEAVTLSAELGLEGVVIAVEGRVGAFALGERLNRETAVCHFEKSDPFMEGISQLVNREFCRLFTDCTFVNREQDLGEPGLRTAKLSYHPVELVRKFWLRKTPEP
ncbi:DUF2156 domain-containing protein [Geobacter sulfurreducens]|jgi:hypothetical protein|uniref:Phosphatidylglycerol lysyltransferase C-terminal domain-containing protein n=1 Tax=Geobacter sulfurreducens (strain ATCC 51573 / DSM 12127 / PCA) TaxID=243231 RepID=Q74EB7_GEOSL|nr:DUF2156 domain-containing protein [Geobacter sulfurreducens]AAR34372.1 protein of unknown function DUF2156 [Geobacter sulfurreducens PCA]AJY70769.1 hypothetical protein RW64_14875 [Geobacter sulfurreducens]UAC05093.1 DUF2156 domain-containing protein [Geobacter sulfurreducens]UTG93730.1 DUF2156 domain-containing protein [Geobacter sulfurreducens]HCD95659.1 DUF2156 domain-containing protein [Geobacter sulfurreducens]